MNPENSRKKFPQDKNELIDSKRVQLYRGRMAKVLETAFRAKDSSEPLIFRLRGLRDRHIELNLFEAASYWADKIVSMSDDLNDICALLEIYHVLKLTKRGEHIYVSMNLKEKVQNEKDVDVIYRLAVYVQNIERWDDLVFILGVALSRDDLRGYGIKARRDQAAAIYYLLGIAYCNLNSLTTARNYFEKSVHTDPRLMASILWLRENHIITKAEEKAIVDGIDFEETCGEDAEFIKHLYYMELKNETSDNSIEIISNKYKLSTNCDVLILKAEHQYNSFNYKPCIDITKKILQTDFFNFRAILAYVACLSEMKMANQIYDTANKFIKSFTYNAVTWYIVGVYYLTIGKNLAARKYLKRAVNLDPSLGQAWVGFAQTFVEEGQIEQSLAAYSSCTRLMTGMHQPLMYMGTQHLILMNMQMAEGYFNLAYGISPNDPSLLNEMGVLHYKKREYNKAAKKLGQALSISLKHDMDADKIKTIYSNLGNVYRRMKDYDRARTHYKNALLVDPSFVEALMGIGYIDEILGEISESILSYNKVLFHRPDFFKARDLFLLNIKELSMGASIINRSQVPSTKVPSPESTLNIPFHIPDICENLNSS